MRPCGAIASSMKYLLPCRHILHLDTEVKVLTPSRWEGYMMMLAECGIEVYGMMGAVWVDEESSGERNAERASIDTLATTIP